MFTLIMEYCRYNKALAETIVWRKLTRLRTMKLWLLHQGSQSLRRVTAKAPCLP